MIRCERSTGSCPQRRPELEIPTVENLEGQARRGGLRTRGPAGRAGYLSLALLCSAVVFPSGAAAWGSPPAAFILCPMSSC